MTDQATQMNAPLNRIVLVTGASRGLGHAIARAEAATGAHVIALARTVGGLEALDDAIRAAGGSATLVPLDVTDDEGLTRLGAAVAQKWGRLDAWWHCAVHAPPCAPASHADAKDVDRAWAVNARAVQRMIRVLDPLLRASPAGLAVLTDDAREGQPYFAPYAATKAAARAWWDAWALEVGKSPLRVRRVTPPAMPTALRARFFPGQDADALTQPAEAAAQVMAQIAAEAKAA
jgi:NAD(P)-dependent dehydrogenase (short-subunit alcohol dehydrogenase family)